MNPKIWYAKSCKPQKKGTAVTVPMDWHRCELRRPFGYIIAIYADKVKHLCRKGRCFFYGSKSNKRSEGKILVGGVLS